MGLGIRTWLFVGCMLLLSVPFADGRGRKEAKTTQAPAEKFEDGLADFAASVIPFQVVGTAMSVFGALAVIHLNIQKLFVKQTRWTLGLYMVMVTVFCYSLLTSVWSIVWPLSGAEVLLTGGTSKEGKNTACSALAFFGPVRILNLLFTGIFVMFVPTVMIPPKQRESWDEKEEGLPNWAYLWLVRMYGIVFCTQLFNIFYIYEFFQLNLTAMTTLGEESVATLPGKVAEGKHWIEVNFGIKLNTTNLEQLYDSDGLGELTPISAMVLYLVVLWCALVVTYERLSRRSFKNDFPRGFLIVLCPWLKQFETVAGQVAKYYNEGQESFASLVEKLRFARAIMADAPRKIKKSMNKVRLAFQQVKDKVKEYADRAKSESHGQLDVETLRKSLKEQVKSTMEESLTFKDSQEEYFSKVQDLVTGGLDFDDGGIVDFAPLAADEFLIPIQGFVQNLEGLALGAIDDACDALAAFQDTGDKFVDKAVREINTNIDMLSDVVIGKMNEAHNRCQSLVERIEEHSKQMIEFVDNKQELIVSLSHDASRLADEGEHIIQTLSKLSCRASPFYRFFYRGLWLVLTFAGYIFKIMAFSTVFVFWDKWSTGVRMIIGVMLILFGILIAFNNVFFSEAAAGRLGRVLAARGGVDFATRDVAVEEDAEKGQHMLLSTEATDDERPMLSSRPSATINGGKGSSESAPKDEASTKAAGKALQLVIAGPAVAVLLIIVGAYLLHRAGGLDASICVPEKKPWWKRR